MMKESLVLLVILALPSFASAAIVLVSPEPATVSIQTDPIDAVEAQQAFYVAVTSGLELGAGELLYPGTLAAITDLTGFDPDLTAAVEAAIGAPPSKIDFVELFDGTATPPPVTGQLVKYPVIGGVGMVCLLMETSEVLCIRVPESLTIVLLCLGGLFLRRRR